MRLLGSQRYVRAKLEGLTAIQLAELKATVARNGHVMFREIVGAVRHEPKGAVKNYREEIENADLDKLAKLIKIAAILLQTKVYLFWSQAADNQNHKP